MRRLFAVVAVVLVALPLPRAGAVDDVDVADLLADPVAYADTRIALVGEFVGDYGFRPDGTVWTQLNDDPYATAPLHAAGGTPSGGNVGVGVVGDVSMFGDLDPPGRFDRVGPVVRAIGVWRYHDDARGGESYLELTDIEPIWPGYPLQQPLNRTVLAFAIGLSVVAVLLFAGVVRGRRHS